MGKQESCTECGQALRDDALGGLCPRCMAAVGFGFGFGFAGESLESSLGENDESSQNIGCGGKDRSSEAPRSLGIRLGLAALAVLFAVVATYGAWRLIDGWRSNESLDESAEVLSGANVPSGRVIEGSESEALKGFSGTDITDLSILADWPLERLEIPGAAISDLSPLIGKSISHMDLSGTAVRDLSGLAGMPIRWLNLDRTLVDDLSPLLGAPLEQLSFLDTRVADLKPLEGLPLQRLHFSNPVESLAPVRGLWLEELTIHMGDESTLSFLLGHPLRSLHIIGDQPIDVSALEGDLLHTLVLDVREVESMDALMGCTLLERLLVRSELASQLGAIRQHPSLKQLGFIRDMPSGDWAQVPTVARFWQTFDGDP